MRPGVVLLLLAASKPRRGQESQHENNTGHATYKYRSLRLTLRVQ